MMRNGKIFTHFQIVFKFIFVFSLFALPLKGFAQYDYEHYVPPFYDGSSTDNDIGYHEAILSTNSIKDVNVEIYKGYSTKIATLTIKQGSPAKYVFKTSIGTKGDVIHYPDSYDFPWNVVGAKELNKVLPDEGLRFFSLDGPFFVNIRHSTKDQGGSLTTKGTYAYGTEFLSGHVYTSGNSATSRRSHFISVMATEDNTVVDFTDIKVSMLTQYDTVTKKLEAKAINPTDVISSTLMKGESYVIGVDHDLPGFSDADKNAMIGTSIKSSKPIVVNTGSWTSGPYKAGQDIGIDQIVPIDQLRNEYIVMRGKGNSSTERPIVVATEDNTEVKVNGAVIGTIAKKGEYLALADPYDGNGNAYIFSDKNIYVYQTLSGSSSRIGPTVGMNFIPPVSTSGIREVTVPYAELLAEQGVNGVITILAQTGSVISYSRNGETTLHPLSDIANNPVNISGVPQWEIYKLSNNLTGSYRFYSNKAINVAWLVESGVVGAAGYYSGFTKAISKIIPDLGVNIDANLDLICESYNANISVSIKDPLPDFYEWYVNDFTKDPIIVNGPLVVPAPDVETTYYVVGSYRDPLMDQLYNGSFFELSANSDYTEVIGNLRNPGEYTVDRQTTDADPSFKSPSFTDMDNDYMLMAISKDRGDTIYRGTSVDVVKGFNYIVKLFGRKMVNAEFSADQSLQIFVNGDTIIKNFTLDDPNAWQSKSALWKPGDAANAIIKICNNNAPGIQSAFALDSITFVQAVQDTAAFVARVVPNYSYGNSGNTFHFCEGSKDSLDVSNGDTSWYDYSWAKNDGTGTYVDLTDNSEFSGTKTFKLMFLNPHQANEGDYRCTIGFKPEYQQCGNSDSNVNVDLHVLVDKPASLTLTADKTNFCYGTTASISALVTGDAGAVKWFVNDGTDPVSVENPYIFINTYAAGTYAVKCQAENGCGIASASLDLNVLSAPNLTDLTVNADLCEGQDVILTASATGNEVLNYNWKNGTTDLSEHGSSLTFPASMTNRSDIFSVSVSSIYTVDEKPIVCPDNNSRTLSNLDILPLVTFQKELEDVTLCEGTASHTFAVETTEAESFYNYTWLKDGNPQPDASSQKIISPITIGDDGVYKVSVSNRCDTKESTATLSVTPKLVVNDITVDKTGPFCDPTTVVVTFDDNGAVSAYKAKKPDGTIIDITPVGNQYSFEVNDASQGVWEFIVEPNCGGSSVSRQFTLNMIPDFGNVSMNNNSACIGNDVSFTVDIDNIPVVSILTYEWKDNNNAIVGDNLSSLALTNIQESNTGNYTCKVTDQCGRSKTATANLSIEKVITATTSASIVKCVGDTDFRIDIDYVGTPTFDWRFNDPTGAIIGTNDFFALASVSKTDEGIYYCTVSLPCGDQIKIERKLVVNEHISIVNPADETIDICQGEQPVLKVEVNGNADDYTIQWTDDSDVDLGFGDVNQIQLAAINTPGTYTYKAKVDGFCDNLEKIYKVVVHEKPVITSVDPIIACEGDIPMAISVTGSDFDHAEWWSPTNSKLADGLAYTIPGATFASSQGTYIAKVITNYCGNVETNVLVKIHEPVVINSTSNLNPTPCVGEPLSLVVNASGDGLTYNWYKSTAPASTLSTSNTLDLGSADLADNGTYTCEVNSSNGCVGDSRDFNVTVKNHVSITTQPSDVSICESDSPADFSVIASGEGTLTYKWKDNSGTIVGSGSTLSITNPATKDGENYYCIINADYCDGATSNKASLDVIQEVAITKQPDNITIAETGNATFSVTVSGDPVLIYQWQENSSSGWNNISNGGKYSGTDSNTLTITNVDAASYNSNQYRCVVDNDCAPATSNAAVLTVDLLAKITSQPQSLDACDGDSGKTLTIAATGTGLTYEWQYRENTSGTFVNVTTGGMTNGSTTLTLPVITSAMANWEFQCVVKGTGPDDTSNTVKINVFQPLNFDDISDETLCVGSGTHFQLNNLSGSEPYSYSWKRNGVEIRTSAQLNLSAADALDDNYSIEVTNNVCPTKTTIFSIDHFTPLTVNAWANDTKACVSGTSVDLSVTASTDSRNSLNYSWTKDELTDILSVSDTYTIPGIDSNESGLYKVELNDRCSSKSISGFVNVYDPIVKVNTWDSERTLCLGEDLILDADVTGDAPTYVWTVPNAARTEGISSSIKFDALTIDDAGTYTCTVTGECGNPVVYTTTVNVLSTPVITTGIDAIPAVCEGEPLKLGPVVSTQYDDLVWTLNDESTNNTAGLSLDLGNASLSQEGNYKVTVSNICGSAISVGHQVVNPIPVLEPIPNQESCQDDDVIFRAKATGRNLNYQWFIDDVDQGVNNEEFIMDAIKVLPEDEFTAKVYHIKCVISSPDACGTDEQTAILTVNPSTILKSTLKNVVEYVGDNYTMSLAISGADLEYHWTHEVDGVKTELTGITGPSIDFTDIQMSDAGYYNCRIIGTCGQRLASGKLTVKEPVKVDSELSSLEEKCEGEPLSLSLQLSGQVDSVKWYKDDVLLSKDELNLYIPELTINDAGAYTYEVYGEGVDVIKHITTVRVYPLTSLNAPLENQPICEGDELTWSPDISGADDLNYVWSFNGTEVYHEKLLSFDAVTLAQEGDYEVQVTGLCGDVSTSGKLEVTKLPVFISASESKPECENTSSVEFTAEFEGENLKYEWRKNEVVIPGQTAPVLKLTNIQLDDGGTYTCRAYSDCGESISSEINLTVIPQLVINSELVDTEVCDGEEVEFTTDVVGNNVSYQWKKDGVNIDGEINTSLNITPASPDDNGYYTCVVSDDCTDSRSTKPTELTVHKLPNTEIFGRMVLCAKEDRVTYVTIDQPDITYGWGVDGGIFAGPEEGVRTRITWEEVENGQLSVTISDLETGCESKVDSLVTLNSLPNVNLSTYPSKGVCESAFTLKGGYPEGGIYWVDGISQKVFDPSGKGPGNYNIFYTYTDTNGCSNVSSTTNLRIDTLPVVDITDDLTIGNCKPFQLNAETKENNITWSPADNLDDANSMTPIFTPGESQVIVASVKDEHACVGIDLVNLNVAALPEVTTINDTIVSQCNQLELTTDIVGDMDKISWTNAEQLDDPDTRSPHIVNALEGTYTYKISVTDLYGCDATDEVTVQMVADPKLGDDKFACEGDHFEVNVAGMENPVWEDAYAEESRTISDPGKYLLEVSNEYGCGDEQTFVINPTPKLNLKDTLIFEGESVMFSVNLPSEFAPYFYEWQDGSILPRFEVSETGLYTLKVEDNLGCTAQDSAYVEVKPVGIESPSAFTPKSNNENDKFYLKDINVAEEFEMYVYDRWGELLFQTSETGYNGGWDGTYKGKICPAGAYVWVAFINGKLTNKGTFVLVR